MTVPATVTALPNIRAARARHYLMCRPTYFAVEYAINPWMDPDVPVDTALAMRQWEGLRDVYRALGHQVDFVDPQPGLPDMVFAANGALVVGGKVLGAHFLSPERQPEAPAYRDWFDDTVSLRRDRPDELGERGRGRLPGPRERHPRRHRIPHRAVARTWRRRSSSASPWSRCSWSTRASTTSTPRSLSSATTTSRTTRRRSRRAAWRSCGACSRTRSRPTENDAMTFGLNSVSDGRNVVVPVESTNLTARLIERGYDPVPVELSEFRKAGGGPKCCTSGDPAVTVTDASAGHAAAPRNCRPLRPQLPPAARRGRLRVRQLGHRRRRSPVPGLPRRVLGAELRPRAPGDPGRRARAARARHADVSRAFDHDQLYDFCAELGDLGGKEMVLPMNTGAEAVETAIKVARKWGYEVKGVPDDRATIIVADGNFHGRTTTIVSFSTDPDARDNFGPFTPGFRVVPYGDAAALAAAIDDDDRRRADRADPGRGRRARPAAGLPARRPLDLHARRRAVRRGRDPVRPRPHRRAVRLRPRGRRPGHVPAGQGPRRRRRPGLGGARRRATCSGFCGRVSTAARSAATRWPAPSAARSSGCSRQGSTSAGPATSATLLHRRLNELTGVGVTAVRGLGLWAGIDIDPCPRDGPGGLRAAHGPRRPREGHARLDDPPRPAAGRRGRRARLGRRPTPGRPARLGRAPRPGGHAVVRPRPRGRARTTALLPGSCASPRPLGALTAHFAR